MKHIKKKMPGGGKMPMKMKSGGKMKKYMGGGKSPMKMPGGGKLAKQAAIAMAMKKAGKKPKSMKKGGKTKEKNGKTNPAFFQVLPKETPKQMKRRLEQEKVDKMYPGGAPYDDDAPAGKKSMKKGGKFPDLNKDGKITMADILMGRGVKAKKGMKGMKYQKGGKLDPKKKIEKGKDLIFNKAQKASQEGKFKKADRMVKRGAKKIARASK